MPKDVESSLLLDECLSHVVCSRTSPCQSIFSRVFLVFFVPCTYPWSANFRVWGERSASLDILSGTASPHPIHELHSDFHVPPEILLFQCHINTIFYFYYLFVTLALSDQLVLDVTLSHFAM